MNFFSIAFNGPRPCASRYQPYFLMSCRCGECNLCFVRLRLFDQLHHGPKHVSALQLGEPLQTSHETHRAMILRPGSPAVRWCSTQKSPEKARTSPTLIRDHIANSPGLRDVRDSSLLHHAIHISCSPRADSEPQTSGRSNNSPYKMPLAVVQDATNGPLTMLWGLLVSFLASLTARAVVSGQSPSGRTYDPSGFD